MKDYVRNMIKSIEKLYMDVYEPGKHYDEKLLEDNYPVFFGFWYLVDGEPTVSHLDGNAKQLKNQLGAKEIRSCDCVGRQLPPFDKPIENPVKDLL